MKPLTGKPMNIKIQYFKCLDYANINKKPFYFMQKIPIAFLITQK